MLTGGVGGDRNVSVSSSAPVTAADSAAAAAAVVVVVVVVAVVGAGNQVSGVRQSASATCSMLFCFFASTNKLHTETEATLATLKHAYYIYPR